MLNAEWWMMNVEWWIKMINLENASALFSNPIQANPSFSNSTWGVQSVLKVKDQLSLGYCTVRTF